MSGIADLNLSCRLKLKPTENKTKQNKPTKPHNKNRTLFYLIFMEKAFFSSCKYTSGCRENKGECISVQSSLQGI